MSTTYPTWIWADTNALRVELAHDQFVDYVRVAGAWRQKTRPMTNKESVTPERHWLNDWRVKASDWPVVDADMGVWLETTYAEVAR